MTALSVEHDCAPAAVEWDALADRLGASPFLRRDWFALWWHAFGTGTLEVVCASRAGRLAGVVPVVRQYGTLRSPTNAHTPLFGALAEDAVVAATLAEDLLGRGSRHVMLAYVGSTDPTLPAIRRAAAAAGYRAVERTIMRSPYLDITGDLGAYYATRRPRFLADLRRRRRRLDECGAVTVSVGRTAALLDDALVLEARGWKARRKTAIVERARVRGFYADVARWAAAQGTLRLLFLCLDCQAIAFLLGLEEGGTLYLLKGGYDPSFARFSPGQLVLQEAIAYAFDAGLRRVELLGADEPYKLAWTTTTREIRVLHAFRPSVLGVLGWVMEGHARPLLLRVHADRLLRPMRDRILARLSDFRRVRGRIPWE
jgi:CelD/BcsL family acetyltransferase involved in cellulose biosynthesis